MKYVPVRITILANYALLCIPVFLKREETAKKTDKLKIYVGFSRTRCMEDQQLVRFFFSSPNGYPTVVTVWIG
jgi:hypothetical protein